MLYNRCMGIYKFGNNTYPRRIRRRSNLGHIFWKKKCVFWAGKYGIWHSWDHTSWHILVIKANEMHNFSNLLDKVLYTFRTGPPSIIRSISTLYPQPTELAWQIPTAVCTVLRYSWWGTVDLSETCRVLYLINLRNYASHWLLLQELFYTFMDMIWFS